MSAITRRRFLSISAAGLAAGVGLSASTKPVQWTGRALGADVSITIHDRFGNAEAAITQSVSEIAKLEKIFSLYDESSDLYRLNATGHVTLTGENKDHFFKLFTSAYQVYRNTNGLFDPTVQPVFQAYKDAKGSPTASELKRATDKLGWWKVVVQPDGIRYAQPGVEMTLNGIAQGYITDHVKRILAEHGYKDTIVNMGEYNAGDGLARIGIAGSDGNVFEVAVLQNQAIATSSPLTLKLSENLHHIIHPNGITTQPRWDSVSVIAQNATDADGYSTALALAPDTSLAKELKSKKVVDAIILKDLEGNVTKI